MARTPDNPGYEERVRASFAKQGLMKTLGATLGEVSPGLVEIAIRPDPAISQQHRLRPRRRRERHRRQRGGLRRPQPHACRHRRSDRRVQDQPRRPGGGERIIARGRVVRAGRTLTLAQTEVFAESGGQQKLIALLTATLMVVKGRDGISD